MKKRKTSVKKVHAASSPVLKKKKHRSKPFPIVAIGASAGGIEAVTELLKNLSPDTGMAYVYIQHLDPTHQSLLSVILSKLTKMPVMEAEEMMRIEKNHLYIIPPNKEMYIEDDVFTLNPRPPKPAISMPINRFFISLADKQKEGSIGIVLSGNASDGALGLRAIKNGGGITFAQDESAKFQSMPRSAIAEGGADMVMSPKEIAAKLEELKDHMPLINEASVERKQPDPKSADDDINPVLKLIKNTTGADFTHYKLTTIRRRIIRRMLLQKMQSIGDYHKYLLQNKGELNMLYADFLVNVTSFFRDEDTLNYLRKKALPALIKSKGAGDSIRIWVPACSSGEEAYSIAMLITEALNGKTTLPVQVFASDLSENAIVKARSGTYSKADVADIPEKQLTRFFTQTDGSYRIIKSIRDLCVFANHNIFKDPPFSRIDIVSCCNLLIYLDEVLQKRLLNILHYSLNEGGILILGKSESASIGNGLFFQVDKKIKTFLRKKESTNRYQSEGAAVRAYDKPATPLVNTGMVHSDKNHTDLERAVDEILLDRFAPASVVVTREMDILQFRGSTSLFLEPVPGRASLNLLKMARPGLGFELRNAVHKAFKSGKPVKKTGIEILNKNNKHYVSIEVLPLKENGSDQLYLIVFEENIQPVHEEARTSSGQNKKVRKLEEELMSAREDMRLIIEEHDAVNEELQSANEKVVSTNEELQSINEELETSKEEIESANEELMTINSELQIRNDQLNEANDRVEAILSTLREAILILDKNLRVVRANVAFYQTFGVSEEQTENTYIYDLGNGQWNIPGLRRLLEEIIPDNSYFNDYEVRHNFPSIGEKIMILNARRVRKGTNNETLILLAIEDLTAPVLAKQLIENEKQRVTNIIDAIPQMIVVSSPDGKPAYFNQSWHKYTGQTEQEALATGPARAIHPDEISTAAAMWDEFREQGESIKVDFRYLRKSDHTYRWHFTHTSPAHDAQGKIIFWITTFTDIHEQKMLVDEMEKQVNERTHDLKAANISLQNSNSELQQFAYVASHDLQEPLRKITTFSDRLQEQFREDLPAKGKEYLDKILSSSQRMSRLIEDILNYSRVGNTNEPFVETDLNVIYEDTIKDFDLILQEKKAQVSTNKLPIIKAIPFQIGQLFHNLIGNALKFSFDGKAPVVTIQYHMINRDKINNLDGLDSSLSYFEMIFRDNGIGFDQGFSEQIFQIFQRLNSGNQYPGTGIGLALCKKIVAYHGGMIFANSQPGAGSSFHVILPLNAKK